jgi:hypothetical protein
VDFDDIYVVSDRLETASASEVALAAGEIGGRFPTGYSEYVQRFGRGSLNDLLRVMLPGHMVSALASWRDTKSEYWFWNDLHPDVGRDRVLDSVPLADTSNGDQLCFHRDDPDVVIVLPRGDARIYVAEPGLAGAVDWVFSSGVLQRPQRPSAFESALGRKYVRHQSSGRAGLVRVRGELLALGTHALVDQTYDTYSVVYFPSIQGRVALLKLDDGKVDALITHDEGAPASSLDEIQTVLERAGLPYQHSW